LSWNARTTVRGVGSRPGANIDARVSAVRSVRWAMREIVIAFMDVWTPAVVQSSIHVESARHRETSVPSALQRQCPQRQRPGTAWIFPPSILARSLVTVTPVLSRTVIANTSRPRPGSPPSSACAVNV
jgi:hypothetical protein